MTGRSGSQGTESESNPPADAVESVPGYRELARIGHGGFSVVYRAVQESFERDVALKVLSVGPDEDARRRFLREVRLASKLSGHPHVVTVLDTGTTASGRPYLAMDLYDGGSMKERIRRSGPLTAAETAVVGAKIAEALAAAHSLGVLHRDVKPNNILVSRFGEPALADFGVSCLLDSSSSASVLDVFSPQHAAPELMTRGEPSASSDVYALGSTLYELLTGRPPFGAESRDVRAIMWRAMTEPAPRPDCPDLPELADVIVRALAKEPEERFPDAAAFAKTLRALIPDGTPSTLVMPALTESAAGSLAATAVVAPLESELDTSVRAEVTGSTGSGGATGSTGSTGEPGFGLDDTYAGRRRGVDETMVRPDRADPPSGPGPKSRDRGEKERRRRGPLIIVVAVALLGAGVWAVIATQGPSTGARAQASSQDSSAAATASVTPTRSASAKSSASATPTATHTAVAVVQTTKASSAPTTASASPSTKTSTGGLLGLGGSYYRYQNGQSGDCLTASGGSATQQSCGSSQSQGWEYTVPVGGLLNVVTGEFELVNESSGDCLAAGSGGVEAASCDGGSSQLWTKLSGSSSGDELRNVGSGSCLRSSGGGLVSGSCSSSDQADLWSEDGTV